MQSLKEVTPLDIKEKLLDKYFNNNLKNQDLEITKEKLLEIERQINQQEIELNYKEKALLRLIQILQKDYLDIDSCLRGLP